MRVGDLGRSRAPGAWSTATTAQLERLFRIVGVARRRGVSPRVPPPAVRRPAAARCDRHGAGLRAAARRAGRADDRARRHHAGRDPAARSVRLRGEHGVGDGLRDATISRSSRRSPTASPSCTAEGSSRWRRDRGRPVGAASSVHARAARPFPITWIHGSSAPSRGRRDVRRRPPGCAFAPRCRQRRGHVRRAVMPQLEEITPGTRFGASFPAHEVARSPIGRVTPAVGGGPRAGARWTGLCGRSTARAVPR